MTEEMIKIIKISFFTPSFYHLEGENREENENITCKDALGVVDYNGYIK